MSTSNRYFSPDPIAQNLLRTVLILTLAALPLGLRPALARPGATGLLVVLCLSAAWLYARYRAQPPVRERRALQADGRRLRARMRAETSRLKACRRQRDRLAREERAELDRALREIQQRHVEIGLASARLVDANLPNFGPALKQRLTGQGLASAADVNAGDLLGIKGLGDARCQALLDWRAELTLRLRSTMPDAIPARRIAAIHRTFERQQAANDPLEAAAQAQSAACQVELLALEPRIAELSVLTFPGFIRTALGGGWLLALLACAALLVAQGTLLAAAGIGLPPALATPTLRRTPNVATRTALAGQRERPIARAASPAPRSTRPASLTVPLRPRPSSTRIVATRLIKTRRAATGTKRPSRTPTASRTARATARPVLTATPRPTHTPSETRTPQPSRTPTETHTPRPSHTPTETHTPKPTRTATVTASPSATIPAGQFQELVSLTSPIKGGESATLTVHTAPGLACSIRVYYKSGLSKTKGLEERTAGEDGLCSWTWKVSTRAAPGTWRIVVRTGEVEAEYAFVIE